MPSSGSTIQTRAASSRALSSLPSSESTASPGRCSASSAHQQLVGGGVAGVLELAALEALAAHLEQALSGDGGQPGGEDVVVGGGFGGRRTGFVGHGRQPMRVRS